MEKNSVIAALQERAREQQILQRLPFPHFFVLVTNLLGENPWRILIPIAVGLTLLFHALWGRAYDEAILWLFSYV